MKRGAPVQVAEFALPTAGVQPAPVVSGTFPDTVSRPTGTPGLMVTSFASPAAAA